MPQTAASVEERVQVLMMLVSRFPDVMWELCIGEIPRGPRHAIANYRPKWRADATGAGGITTSAEYAEFRCEAWRLLVSWDHDPTTLGDLVERLPNLNANDQATVWGFVDTWTEAPHGDHDRAMLRERIRNSCLTRRGRRVRPEGLTERAKKAIDKLLPADLIDRHAWLFANGWVNAPWEEGVDDPMDWQAQEAKVHELRKEAMAEIWSAQGLKGALAMVDHGDAAEVVGRYAGTCAGGTATTGSVLRECLGKQRIDEAKLDAFMRGVIGSVADPSESDLLLHLGRELDSSSTTRLLRCAPFNEHTWRILDKLPVEVRRAYWQHVIPYGWTFSREECREIIDRLLEARRPRAAFHSMNLRWASIDAHQLTRLLTAVSTVFDEPTGHFPVDSFDLSDALDVLDAAPETTTEQMAQLEFVFIDALEHSEHGMPNLERAVERSPSLFVQAVRQGYRRDDGTEDSEEQADGAAAEQRAAYASYGLLDSIKRVPGTRDDGTISEKRLVRWVNEARAMCAEVGRKAIGDVQIGALLSRASDEDGEWPCTAICEAMEVVHTDELAEGFVTGKRNTRGVVVGDPAPQDQALAERYRRWSERRRADFPFVGDALSRLASTYDRNAEMWERQAAVDKRLGR